MMATFSMASMTDVIFLLLIFFMVTSAFIFPSGLEVNLPSSNEQSAIKPSAKIYIDANQRISVSYGENPIDTLAPEQVAPWLLTLQKNNPETFMALYADRTVPYGEVVKILALAKECDLDIVLATQPAPTVSEQSATTTQVTTVQTNTQQ